MKTISCKPSGVRNSTWIMLIPSPWDTTKTLLPSLCCGWLELHVGVTHNDQKRAGSVATGIPGSH
eukprot:1258132-Rhodomonas_salina.1